MSASDRQSDAEVTAGAPPDRYASVLPDLVERFRASGVVGVVVVGAKELGRVERFYGDEAQDRVAAALVADAGRLAGDLAPGDLVLLALDSAQGVLHATGVAGLALELGLDALLLLLDRHELGAQRCQPALHLAVRRHGSIAFELPAGGVA